MTENAEKMLYICNGLHGAERRSWLNVVQERCGTMVVDAESRDVRIILQENMFCMICFEAITPYTPNLLLLVHGVSIR